MKKTVFTLLTAVAVLGTSTAFAEEGSDRGEHKGKGHLAKVDLNKDGKISLSEFLEKSKARFAKMDGNKDGYITREEMKSARKKMREHMKDRRSKMKERRESREANGSSEE